MLFVNNFLFVVWEQGKSPRILVPVNIVPLFPEPVVLKLPQVGPPQAVCSELDNVVDGGRYSTGGDVEQKEDNDEEEM